MKKGKLEEKAASGQEQQDQRTEQKEQLIEFSSAQMLKGIKEAVKVMLKMMRDARVKYGRLYNVKNEYEEFCRRFGTSDAAMILHEFDLIRVRQSKQPAVIRKVIKELGDNAFRYCYVQWAKEQEKNSKQPNDQSPKQPND